MKSSTISFLVITAALAGCGAATENQRQSFDQLATQFDEIDAKFERGSIAEISDPATLPTMGSFNYAGVIGANLANDSAGLTSVIGQLSLDANFADSSISGDATNFVDANELRYTGALDIADGTISRDIDVEDTFTFIADLTGTLNNNGTGSIIFDTFLVGDFYGPNEEFVGGQMSGGTITNDQGTFDGSAVETYFVGER